MKLSRPLRLQPLAAAIALTMPVAGYAQLEEVIVTAERRAASELSTAISVEVFTQAQLNMDRLQTVEDLQNMTPNLTVNYQGFTIQSVNIRGVGNAVGNPNIQPGVVVMKDGMIAGETVVIQQNFLDVDSIEILRGPQGTFVGQASTGGAVVINAARPNFDGINGWIETRMGDYADSKLSGAINLPLTENVSTRFAFSNETRDSYYNNNLVHEQGPPTYWETGLHPGNMDSQSFRASILFQPHDRLSVVGRAEFNTIWSDSDAPYQPNPRRFRNPFDPSGWGQSQYYAYSESQLNDTDVDPYTLAHNVRDGYMESVTNLFSLDITYNFQNGLQFNSRTGYQDNDLRTTGDTDATRATGQHWRIDVGPDNDYYNQEFTLLSPADNRMTWIVGTAWYHRFTPVQVATDTWLNGACGYQPSTGQIQECLVEDRRPHRRLMADVYTIQRHAGLFGQLTYDISDTLELEFGARMSWDNNINYLRVHLMWDQEAPPGYRGPPIPVGPCRDPEFIRPAPFDAYNCLNAVTLDQDRAKFKEDEPTWKIGLNWTPGDEHFIYGFYSRGYKSGGVDGGTRFENEIVDHYEFGYKSTLLDGRMQVQAAAFYMDYQEMQQEAFHILFEPGQRSNNDGIINVGESTIEGIELEIDAQFGNFGLNFGAGLVDSALGGFSTVDIRLLDTSVINPGQLRRGCRPGEAPDTLAPGDIFPCFDYVNSPAYIDLAATSNLFSPEFSWNMAIDYAIPLDNGATVRPRMSYSYADAAYSSLFQTDDYYRTDERNLTNFSISYERDAWAAYLFCNNCADEVYITSAVNNEPSRVVYNPPRTLGVRFRYDFE